MLSSPEHRPVGKGAGGLRPLAQCGVVGTLLLLASASALASLPARGQDRPLAIVFPPWTEGREALAGTLNAGYRVLRAGRLDSIVIVAPSDAGAALPRGAWMALSLAGLAGCLDAAAAQEDRS